MPQNYSFINPPFGDVSSQKVSFTIPQEGEVFTNQGGGKLYIISGGKIRVLDPQQAAPELWSGDTGSGFKEHRQGGTAAGVNQGKFNEQAKKNLEENLGYSLGSIPEYNLADVGTVYAQGVPSWLTSEYQKGINEFASLVKKSESLTSQQKQQAAPLMDGKAYKFSGSPDIYLQEGNKLQKIQDEAQFRQIFGGLPEEGTNFQTISGSPTNYEVGGGFDFTNQAKLAQAGLTDLPLDRPLKPHEFDAIRKQQNVSSANEGDFFRREGGDIYLTSQGKSTITGVSEETFTPTQPPTFDENENIVPPPTDVAPPGGTGDLGGAGDVGDTGGGGLTTPPPGGSITQPGGQPSPTTTPEVDTQSIIDNILSNSGLSPELQDMANAIINLYPANQSINDMEILNTFNKLSSEVVDPHFSMLITRESEDLARNISQTQASTAQRISSAQAGAAGSRASAGAAFGAQKALNKEQAEARILGAERGLEASGLSRTGERLRTLGKFRLAGEADIEGTIPAMNRRISESTRAQHSAKISGINASVSSSIANARLASQQNITNQQITSSRRIEDIGQQQQQQRANLLTNLITQQGSLQDYQRLFL